ncbi:MAG: A24 family peptidase C-terminal domain-containing protein [Candidatus Bathyarchaeia archaeon]
MALYEWLEASRVSICLLFLFIASIYDVKTREVPNAVWAVFAPLGAALTVASLVFGGLDHSFLILWVLSAALTICLSMALFYLGLFGGADAKALMCISASMPTHPRLFTPIFKLLIPLLPISTFNNAVLSASLLTFVMLAKNLADLIKHKGRIFEGLEGEKLATKFLAFITGFRAEAEKVRSGRHNYIILEQIRRENGKEKRSLKIFQRLNSEEQDGAERIPDELNGKIWVTMGLPFLVFIAVGFAATLFIGDIVFWLAVLAVQH